ncbi:YdcH family protein [Gemmobacter serpentinus]|uniref:YdcH family protein n=1 Tax=Gemmobacter serpentinus TaxID=2652247 RepID=UPI00124CCF79|nr:YdcH family protein [Gemmobacter serpentinus]
MSNTPHELLEEFPAEALRISALKETDAHFARLVEEYHQVNRAVHRAETRVEPVSPERETELRKTRAALKDQIWQRIGG